MENKQEEAQEKVQQHDTNGETPKKSIIQLIAEDLPGSEILQDGKTVIRECRSEKVSALLMLVNYQCDVLTVAAQLPMIVPEANRAGLAIALNKIHSEHILPLWMVNKEGIISGRISSIIPETRFDINAVYVAAFRLHQALDANYEVITSAAFAPAPVRPEGNGRIGFKV